MHVCFVLESREGDKVLRWGEVIPFIPPQCHREEFEVKARAHSRQAKSYCCLQIFSRLQSDTLTSSGLNHTPSSQQNRDICLYSPSALHCQMTSSAQNKHVSQYLDSDASFDALNCEVSDLYGTHGWFCCSHFFTGEVNNGPVFQKLQHFTFQSCEMAPYHCIKRR